MPGDTEFSAHLKETLGVLENLFCQADADGSGALDRTELATVLHRFYRQEKTSRSFRSVQDECDSAMVRHDGDSSGTLDFVEFVKMVCTDTGFRLRMDKQTKEGLLDLVQSTSPMRMADPESAVGRRAGSQQPARNKKTKKPVGNGKEPSEKHIQMLLDKPTFAPKFDQVYGEGMAEYFLNGEGGEDPYQWKKDNSPEAATLSCDLIEVQEPNSGQVTANAHGPSDENPEAAAMLRELQEIFSAADENGNGSLDMQELTKLLHSQYRTERVARSLKQVGREVEDAMVRYDGDSSGTLDFFEYVAMFCQAEEFKFRVPKSLKASVLKLAQQQLERQREEELRLRAEAEAAAARQRQIGAAGTLQGALRGKATRTTTTVRLQRCEVVLQRLVDLFEAADEDQSGSLSAGELAKVVRQMYKDARLMRTVVAVEQEVTKAMRVWDTDMSGSLDCGEFLIMYALSENFRLPNTVMPTGCAAAGASPFAVFDCQALDDEQRLYLAHAGEELRRLKHGRVRVAQTRRKASMTIQVPYRGLPDKTPTTTFRHDPSVTRQAAVTSRQERDEVVEMQRVGVAAATAALQGVIRGAQQRHIDQVTEDELERLEALFAKYDTRGVGQLGAAELSRMFKDLYAGMKVARNLKKVEAEVATAMSEFDQDGDGTLSFEEFLVLFAASESFAFNQEGFNRSQESTPHASVQAREDRRVVGGEIQKLNAAAQRIQSSLKGHDARHYISCFNQVTDAASAIQGSLRGKEGRKATATLQKDHSAREIQSMMQTKQVRDEVETLRLQQEYAAATALQGALIGTVARDNTKELILDTVEVPLVQGAVRAAQERRVMAELLRIQNEEAATALHAAFQGHQSRRFTQEEHEAIAADAARAIQSIVRGRNSRAFVQEWIEEDLEFSASYIQAALQGRKVRASGVTEQAQLEEAAVHITAGVRGHETRAEARAFLAALELDSALTLQASLVAMNARRIATRERDGLERGAAATLRGVWLGRKEGYTVNQEREAAWQRSIEHIHGGILSTRDRRVVHRRRRAYYTKGAVPIQAGLRGRLDRGSVMQESKEYYSGLMPAIHSGLGFFSNLGRSISEKLGESPKTDKGGGMWLRRHRRTESSDAIPARIHKKPREPWWKRKLNPEDKVSCTGKGNAWARHAVVRERVQIGLYARLVARCQMQTGPEFVRVREQIEKDSTRTLPEKGDFANEDAVGCIALERLLCAYAVHNPSVGYCQGMNYLSAMLLMHVRKEEDAFWCLSLLVESILEGYFDQDMAQSRVDLLVFKGLLAERLPAVHAHFESLDFDISMITARWFICIFVDCLPEHGVVEVWLRLFQQPGRNILQQVALAVLRTHQELILEQTDFTSLIQSLQTAAEAIEDVPALMKIADEEQEGITASCETLNTKHRAEVLQEICREARRQHLKKHPQTTEAELDEQFGPICELPGERDAREAKEAAAEAAAQAEEAGGAQAESVDGS